MDGETMKISPVDLTGVKPGDVVKRIWGMGFMESEMRVSAVDDRFIRCDAQRKVGESSWSLLPPGSEPWNFDRVFGVETDDEMGWGAQYRLVLSRITPCT